MDLIGKLTSEGQRLNNIEEVYQYLLNEANTAIVPFYCFGATKDTPWFRLSVGSCDKHEISDVLEKIEKALSKLQ